MRMGVLGTGVVGQTLGLKLVDLGYEVVMGSRTTGNEKAREWAASAGERATAGTFADAARSGDILINATPGTVSLEALAAAGADNLAGKVLIDVSNPLDFSQGMPPTLSVCNTDSVGEQIQRAFPDTLVVKAFNTMNADVMVNPRIVPGSHTVFICGNSGEAKQQVRGLLVTFGWADGDILDLGDIVGARGMEMYLPLWVRLLGATGTGHLNVNVVVGS